MNPPSVLPGLRKPRSYAALIATILLFVFAQTAALLHAEVHPFHVDQHEHDFGHHRGHAHERLHAHGDEHEEEEICASFEVVENHSTAVDLFAAPQIVRVFNSTPTSELTFLHDGQVPSGFRARAPPFLPA